MRTKNVVRVLAKFVGPLTMAVMMISSLSHFRRNGLLYIYGKHDMRVFININNKLVISVCFFNITKMNINVKY